MRIVETELTAEAIRLIQKTHLDYSSVKDSKTLAISQTSGRIAGAHDFGQIRAQAEYFRIVGIVEAYIDTVCNDLFMRRVRGLDIFFEKLADLAISGATSGWSDRKKALRDYHQVSLGDCPGWDDLDAAIVVRNAIAHGMGRLTKRQRNDVARKKVLSVLVALRDDQIVLSAESVDKCVSASVEFIRAVDIRLPRGSAD